MVVNKNTYMLSISIERWNKMIIYYSSIDSNFFQN